MNSEAVNTHVQVFVWTCVHLFTSVHTLEPGGEIAGASVSTVFNLERCPGCSYLAHRPSSTGRAPASCLPSVRVTGLSAFSLLLAGLDDWHCGGLFLVLIGSWSKVGSHVTFSF